MKLSVRQSAEYIGITYHTLNTWRCIGRPFIPYFKTGGKVIYDTVDLDAFLEKHKVESPEEHTRPARP